MQLLTLVKLTLILTIVPILIFLPPQIFGVLLIIAAACVITALDKNCVKFDMWVLQLETRYEEQN